MSRHRLADDVEHDVAPRIAEELELLPERRHGRVEVRMRTQVVLEGTVLLVELDQPVRVAHDRLELSPVADNPRIFRKLINVSLAHICHLLHIEPKERLAGARPLRLNHAPGHPALEYRLAHHFQVVVQRLRLHLLRRAVFLLHQLPPLEQKLHKCYISVV